MDASKERLRLDEMEAGSHAQQVGLQAGGSGAQQGGSQASGSDDAARAAGAQQGDPQVGGLDVQAGGSCAQASGSRAQQAGPQARGPHAQQAGDPQAGGSRSQQGGPQAGVARAARASDPRADDSGARASDPRGGEQAEGIGGVFTRHVKMVYRLCYSYLGSPQDAEDATQATFMKLVVKPRAFESEEHEKAWLLTVAANHCKDVLKSAARTRAAEMPADVADSQAHVGKSDVLEAVLELPVQYKDCVYLHYYEGYKTDEIARMTDTPPSTVRNRLRDARALLKAKLQA